MLRSLLRFELAYHARQITFIVAAILFLALGFIITQGNFGGPEVHKNSPYVVTYITGFVSMFSIFVSTLFCANVVLRDTTYDMEAIIFTTSLQRLPYFMVRLLGLLIASFTILSFTVLGIALGASVASPEATGVFTFRYFLQPLFVFGLPNVFFCSTVIFSVALLTRSVRMVYITGVLLFILYFLASILGNSPLMANSLKSNEPAVLSYLLDPFGLSSFLGDTRTWSVTQRNNQLFPVTGLFLVNRLLWMGISMIGLALSYRYFKFRTLVTAKTRKEPASKAPVKAIPYQQVATRPQGFAYIRATFTAQLKLEAASVFKHIPFLMMLALWVFLNGVDLKENLFHGPYNIRFYTATGFVVEQLRSVRPLLLLLVFYAADLIGRERAANMQGLIFSTPVPNTILWGAKCATLAVMVIAFITVNIATGIVFQLIAGYPHIDVLAYLSLYYYSGLPLFLFAALIIFIQTIIPNKYLGMMMSLVIVGIFVFANTLGIKHPLLRYANLPELTWSPMNGVGHYTNAVNGYLLYWGALAAVLSLLAAAMWQGSTHTTWWQRVRSMGRQWGVTGKLLLAGCLLVWIATGSYLYGKTTQVSTARSGKTAKAWQASYEKKYKLLAQQPQPYIIAVNTSVDLYPESGRYTVKGTYRLRNGSNTPISKLWLGTDPEVTTVTFSIPQAIAGTTDPFFKQYAYTLKEPLLPGREISLQFSMEVIKSGFMPFNSEHSVVSNGSYIELEKYVPYLGYNDRFEIGDAFVRKEKGLPPLMAAPSIDSNYHLIDFETIVSTTADQQVVTVGTLQKNWLDKGRHYFHYKTAQPIAFMFALSSARYAEQKETYKDIALSIYYQPGQTYNVPVMLQAMKDAIDYGNAHFSPYPLRQLTLAEIPYYPGAATAYPGVLFSAERINFMSNYTDSNRFNNTYTITAHEIGHQWWANKLSPLPVAGRPVLTESLAKFTEFMVAEKRFGKLRLRKALLADNNLYFALRTGDGEDESPLYQADQTFVYYQKGGLALYAIKEELGEERMDQALQRLISKHAFPHTKASTTDLLNELYQEATPAQVKYIDDWMKKVIVYDNSMQVMDCHQLPNGKFSLQLQVNIGKTDQTGGKQQTLTPGDNITIAVFDQRADNWNKHTQPIYLQKHLFSKATTSITIITDKKPATVILDPWGYLPDPNQQDNIQPVK
jgi:ABC-2 type transport system permease protein